MSAGSTHDCGSLGAGAFASPGRSAEAPAGAQARTASEISVERRARGMSLGTHDAPVSCVFALTAQVPGFTSVWTSIVRIRICLLLAVAVTLVGATSASAYNVSITRTGHGIPHLVADDWASLGYGYGYVTAQDNLCVVANTYVTSDTQR